MGRASNYNTKQKEYILEVLKSFGDQHITAGELSQCLQKQNTPVGTATIYRYLEQLAEEGILRKYILDGKHGACYQYIGNEHNNCRQHFHLKCLCCGTLLHVNCNYLNTLEEHIKEHHNFCIDHTKTVLYGYCQKCSSKNKNDSNL